MIVKDFKPIKVYLRAIVSHRLLAINLNSHPTINRTKSDLMLAIGPKVHFVDIPLCL